ncbi:MAG: hypothetical protein V1725_02295 [archaeon]
MRGRPLGSPIRKNIIALLKTHGSMYGYQLYKKYLDHYPKVSQRSIYYHLKRGAVLGVFKIKEIRKEKGTYSWGGDSEHIMYELGLNAKHL